MFRSCVLKNLEMISFETLYIFRNLLEKKIILKKPAIILPFPHLFSNRGLTATLVTKPFHQQMVFVLQLSYQLIIY